MDNHTAHPKFELVKCDSNISSATCHFVLAAVWPNIRKKYYSAEQEAFLTSAVTNSNNFRSITSFSKPINELDAVTWTADSWDKPKPESITKSFLKAGIMVTCYTSNQC
jgi:hypothetical protein